MFYISIDNDYHFELAVIYIKKYSLSPKDIVFFAHKSNRNNDLKKSKFKYRYFESHPFSAGNSFSDIFLIFDAIIHNHKISKIKFNKNDIFLFFTEHQINNSLFAKSIKTHGGKVFLLDEGIGPYFANNHNRKYKDSIFNYLKLFIINLFFIISLTPVRAKKGHEGLMFVEFFDKYIDKFFKRYNLPFDRKIVTDVWKFDIDPNINLNSNVALYFTSNFSCFNLEKEEQSIAFLCIKQMCKKFSKVYLKIHPGDFYSKNKQFQFYKNIKFKNLVILDSSTSAIDTIKKFKPKFVASSMSTALFDSIYFGCTPIFLYNLLPKNKSFFVYDYILKFLNYKFIKTIDVIDPKLDLNINLNNLIFDKKIKV